MTRLQMLKLIARSNGATSVFWTIFRQYKKLINVPTEVIADIVKVYKLA